MKFKNNFINKKFSIFFVACILLLFSFVFVKTKNKAHASSPAYSLTTTSTAANSGDTIPVTINMDTGGNDVVVSRVIIRYNKNLVSVATSDVDLTGSVFATGNSCTFPSNYSDATLQNKPCQIISNDATYGILSITLAMPSHLAATQPGTEINSANALVATVNFHASNNITTSDSASLLKAIGGIYYVTNRTYYLDSGMIADDGNGTDLLGSAPLNQSTVVNGDLNGDRFVNGADFSILHSNYNNSTPGNPADINGDGYVNGADFSILHANYSKSL